MNHARSTVFLRVAGVGAWLAATGAAGYLSLRDVTPSDRRHTAIAKLVAVTGSVAFRPDDLVVWSSVIPGQALAQLDHISTKSASAATITLDDGRRLEMGPDSHIVLESGDAQIGRSVNFSVRLLHGKLDVPALAGGSGAKAQVQGLSVVTRSQSFNFERRESRLTLAAERQSPAVVLAADGIRMSGATIAPPTRPASPTPAASHAATSPPPPARAAAIAPRAFADTPPRIDTPRDGSVLWAGPGGFDGKNMNVSVVAPAISATDGNLSLIVTDAASGQLRQRVSGRPGGGTQELTVALGAYSAASGRLRLIALLESVAPGGKPLASKPVDIELKSVPAAGGSRYLVGFGAPPPGRSPAGTVLSAGEGALGGHLPALEVMGGAAMAALMPWLAQRTDVTIVQGARGGAHGYLFVRGRELAAFGWGLQAQRTLVADIARALGAAIVLEADSDALPRTDRVSVQPSELRKLLHDWTGPRVLFVQGGQVQSLSPEFVLRDETALASLATTALGPFRKPVAIVQGGVAH